MHPIMNATPCNEDLIIQKGPSHIIAKTHMRCPQGLVWLAVGMAHIQPIVQH